MASNGKEPQALRRSLWLLAGLNSLEKHELVAAMDDPSTDVRRQSILLAEVLPGDEEVEECSHALPGCQ